MKVSTNWLKEYVDINEPIETIKQKMILAGNEVEDVYKISEATNLIIGHTISKRPHKDSDHLNVLEVDIKTDIITIVCGASNIDVNQKVIVALPGALLPNGVEIKKSVIRGEESNGMICSLSEIGIKYTKENDGIHVLDNNAPIGEDPLKYLGYDDTVIDYELTANRSDLMSILGMSYEIGAIFDKKVKKPTYELKEKVENIDMDITSTTDNCKTYLSRIVKNVVIKESPDFIKNRLIASGIRPINNVVDISNYVMILYGQPLHFFDYDKLGNRIVVRLALPNEEMTTLDNTKRLLKDTDIVITNEKEVVALAGVMGNLSTEITNDTKNILIESAVFKSSNIRNTSKRILRSEASSRFEKGIDKNYTKEALDYSAYLLQEYASGEVINKVYGFDNVVSNDKEIKINVKTITDTLGMDIKVDDIKNIFDRLGFLSVINDDVFIVTVPTRRMDINIAVDLIEEVGRIYGYDNIKGTLPTTMIKKGSYIYKEKQIREIKNRLVSLDLNEVITYSLVSNDMVDKFTTDYFNQIKLLSPLSEDKSILRYSLLPSLLKVFEYNVSRNVENILMFEVGKSYYDDYVEKDKLAILMYGSYLSNSWQNSNVMVDFYVLKGILENLFDYLGLKNRYLIRKSNNLPKEFHPSKSGEILLDNVFIGYIGCIHPNVLKQEIYLLEIDLDRVIGTDVRMIKYKEVSKYPSIKKDVAFIVDRDIEVKTIEDIISHKGSRLLSNIEVFDVYMGSSIDVSKKSVAFTLTFMDKDRTLLDSDVMVLFKGIIDEVVSKLNASVRDS